MTIEPPIYQGCLCLNPSEALIMAMRCFEFQSRNGQRSFFDIEPLYCFRIIGKEEEHENRRHTRWYAFKNKKPTPSWKAVDTVHMAYSIGNRTTERSCK